ncbi:HK97 gp10 family phage protein [Streptomyces sp. Wb2n-11]|uniref:HK97 gp10 family phage protein n=1 Tax=Streptomyces sp. Wb2n-11 TaxID=1030533 RepID=UPI000A9038B6|nr:HK97 gp10 family phage protein [Streptomyces sp. Wb2n-11]
MTPDELADRLEAAADNLGDAIARRVQHTAELGRGMIRANATGRPGPNVITGRYRSSWETVTRSIPYGAECTIGTNQPQGRRLEFGFYDMTDSLGRHYYQPPFPHVGPAVPRMETMLKAQVLAAAQEVLG